MGIKKIFFALILFATMAQAQYVKHGELADSLSSIRAAISGISGIAGITTAENIGASTSASAHTNRVAIQTALNNGGTVTLLTPGTFQVDSTLTVSSNTHFIVGKKTVLLQNRPGNAGRQMLETHSYHVAYVSVSLNYTASTNSVVVTWTNAPVQTGGYILVQNAVPSAFDGVFQVVSKSDTSHLTIYLLRIPATGVSGSPVAKVCDQNIELEGGIWDYNRGVDTCLIDWPNGIGRHCWILAGVQGLIIHDAMFQNSDGFEILTAGTRDADIENINNLTTGSDGVKIYGPAYNDRVSNIFGYFGDDCVSVEPREPATWNTGYPDKPCVGDCMGITIENIDAVHTAGSGILAIYPVDSMYTGGIIARNINGCTTSRAVVCVFGEYDSSLVNDLTIEGVHGSGPVVVACYSSSLFSNVTLSVQSLTLSNVSWGTISLAAPKAVTVDAGTFIRNCVIDKYICYPNIIATSGLSYIVDVAGTIGVLTLQNSAIMVQKDTVTGNYAGKLINMESTGVIDELNLRSDSYRGQELVDVQTGTIQNINISDCRSESWGGVFGAIKNVNIKNTVFINSGGSVIGITGSGVTNAYLSGNMAIGHISWFSRLGGSATCAWHSLDLSNGIDVSTTGIAMAAGAYAYNTNASLGTLGAAGIVYCNGTHWYLAIDPTKLY